MSIGLIALIDDVSAIAKVAAASVDDIAAQAARAGAKSAGVVIDDAAVTPRYVVGFAADRELPIVAKIARGSLRNKLLFLLPAALLLSQFAPWAITPLLMLGGLYLCYEGAEKVFELFFPHEAHGHGDGLGVDHGTGHSHSAPGHPDSGEPNSVLSSGGPTSLEDRKVAGAIKTDFILSAEIMAIALATIPESDLLTQGIVLAIVGIGITVGVYGAVALIVKADDAGVAMASSRLSNPLGGLIRTFGRGLVKFMPVFLKVLTIVGTGAMIWVGGGIIVHGLEGYGLPQIAHFIHEVEVAAGHASPILPGFVEWFISATGAGIVGLVLGGLMIPLVKFVLAPAWTRLKSLRPAAK